MPTSKAQRTTVRETAQNAVFENPQTAPTAPQGAVAGPFPALRRLQALRTAGLQHRVTPSYYNFLAYVAEGHDRATIAEFAHGTGVRQKTIRRGLKRMAGDGIIRLDKDPGRYDVEHVITIIDPTYIQALEALSLVSGQNVLSQSGANTLVSGHGVPSHKNENPPDAHVHGNGHHVPFQNDANTLVSGHDVHSGLGRKEGSKNLQQYIDHLRSIENLPTYEPISESGQQISREMMSHLLPNPRPEFLDAASEGLQPPVIFQICAEFTVDFSQGKVKAGALLHRLADPDLDPHHPAPLSASAAESDFYHRFHEAVSEYEYERQREAMPQEEAGEVDFWEDDGAQNAVESPAQTAEDHLWQKALQELALTMPETTFETWVRDTSITSRTDNEITIGAPHAFARDCLRSRLHKKVKKVLENLIGHPVQVSYEVRRQPGTRTQPERPETESAITPPTESGQSRTGQPQDHSQPQPDAAQARRAAQTERLTALVERVTESRTENRTAASRQYNAIMQTIQTKIDASKAEQLTDDEEDDRIDKLIAHCIATLGSEQQPRSADSTTQTPAAIEAEREPKRPPVHPWTAAAQTAAVAAAE